MMLGVLSDIHGNDAALAAVLEEFRRRQVSRLLFLGDLVGYYPFAARCLELLAGFEVTAVRGNHDDVALRCLATGTPPDAAYRKAYGSALERALAERDQALDAFLQSLPLERDVTIGGRTLHLCHGSPWDPLEGRVYPDFKEWQRFGSRAEDGLIMGHTHYPLVRQCGSLLILNPGSVGQARQRGGIACAALLDVPAMAASLIEVPYDPSAIIADAREHDPDLPYLTNVLLRQPQ
jgi:putative phosphoesterase